MNHRQIIFISLVAAGLAFGAGGCQKQVVSQTYRPMGTLGTTNIDYRPVSASQYSQTPQQPAKKNFFDQVGDALFGWMQPKPEQPAPTRRVQRFTPMWSTPQASQ